MTRESSEIPSALLSAVDLIGRSLGGPSPQTTLVDVEGRRIFATKVDSQLALVLLSVRGVGDSFLRQEAQRLIAKISATKANQRTKRSEKASPTRSVR